MNSNEVTKAYYKLFKDDATLNGSALLNQVSGDKRVWNGRRGSQAENPSLTVNAFPWANNIDIDVYSGQLIINFYADKLSGGHPDKNRLGKILERVENLVNENTTDLPIRSGYLIYHSHVVSSNVGVMDEKSPDEFYGFCRIQLMARNNP